MKLQQNFTNAKVGDKVFSIQEGWTEIREIKDNIYPIVTINEEYTFDGKYMDCDKYPSLFARETVFPREMQVYSHRHNQWINTEIIGIHNELAIASSWLGYSNFREIEDLPEYTHEELEAKLGHKFKLKP